MSGFHVGQLVVCVNDEPATGKYPAPPGRHWSGDLSGLRRGVVYTIRDLEDRYPYDDCVRLQEILRKNCPWGFECAFSADRFRPLDDSKLEVFRKIAASPRKRIEVDA